MIILSFVLILMVSVGGVGWAGDCKFPKKGPNPKIFKYSEHDKVTVTNQRTKAESMARITKVMPWWDMTDCKWKVRYEGELVTVLTFEEDNPAIRPASPGGAN